jgi:hypothetical protein
MRTIKQGRKLMDIAGSKTITTEEWALVERKYRMVK